MNGLTWLNLKFFVIPSTLANGDKDDFNRNIAKCTILNTGAKPINMLNTTYCHTIV
jgi:hypothetical protein